MTATAKLNASYFSQLQRAIETGSLLRLKSTLADVREHYLAFLVLTDQMSPSEAKIESVAAMTVHPLIDVRSKDDLTPLMLVCGLYRLKALKGDARGCEDLDLMSAWLLEMGASLWAEGLRPMNRRDLDSQGRPVYSRARGKTVVELLGQANLPPTVQRWIIETDDNDYTRDRIAA